MKEFIYLDYNASAPIRQSVKDAMIEAISDFGNPSSIHSFGRKTRARIEAARDILADKLEVSPIQVVFTSGGTEANNFCIQAALQANRDVYISEIEHQSVLRCSPDAKTISTTPHGIIDLEDLDNKLSKAPLNSAFVSLMLANNETGVCQPIREASEIIKKYGGRLHCDAVAGFIKLPFTYKELGADYITLSSHKIGGPKGVGALIIRSDEQLPSFIHGGGQEKGHRAGTENVSGIVGFAKAIEESKTDSWENICALRDLFESTIQKAHPEAPIYGKDSKRLPNTSLIGMPGVTAVKQIMALDLEGFAISAGSACSSGKVGPSHVLVAAGVGEQQALEAIRISIGWKTTKDEILNFAQAWLDLYERFKKQL